MISTLGVSGSTGRVATSPRARADRPKRGLGRLGIRTSRVVAHQIRSELESTCAGLLPAGVCLYSGPHSCTHPEGWRDWPYETPATPRYGGKGANSIRLQQQAWEMWPRFSGTSIHIPGGGFFMAVDALKCKECSTE